MTVKEMRARADESSHWSEVMYGEGDDAAGHRLSDRAIQWTLAAEICERLDRVIASLDEGLKAPTPVEVIDG